VKAEHRLLPEQRSPTLVAVAAATKIKPLVDLGELVVAGLVEIAFENQAPEV
jgi:hypothetical protein